MQALRTEHSEGSRAEEQTPSKSAFWIPNHKTRQGDNCVKIICISVSHCSYEMLLLFNDSTGCSETWRGGEACMVGGGREAEKYWYTRQLFNYKTRLAPCSRRSIFLWRSLPNKHVRKASLSEDKTFQNKRLNFSHCHEKKPQQKFGSRA